MIARVGRCAASATTFERRAELVVWLAIGSAGAVMLSQAVGWSGSRLVAIAQTLTPYLTVALAPAAVLAWRSRRLAMAATLSAIGIGGLVLAAPVVFGPDAAPAAAGSSGMRIASVNLLYSNTEITAVAERLDDVDADVVVFHEFTAEHQAALNAHRLVDAYPHRIESEGLLAGGTAAWSRFPISETGRPEMVNRALDILVGGPDGALRLLAVHAPTPVYDNAGWLRDLDTIGDLADSGTRPTAIVGDFNASFWHPPFRALLDRGFANAHMTAGKPWSTSWPVGSFIPPFARLDHALVGNGLVSTDVEDFDVPGSDHRGFVVTVAPAR